MTVYAPGVASFGMLMVAVRLAVPPLATEMGLAGVNVHIAAASALASHVAFTLPSCDAIEIGPLIPLLPTFTSGNAPGSLSTKSGFAVTFSVNDAVKVEGAPAVEACRLMG